jgi:hypothetical protein
VAEWYRLLNEVRKELGVLKAARARKTEAEMEGTELRELGTPKASDRVISDTDLYGNSEPTTPSSRNRIVPTQIKSPVRLEQRPPQLELPPSPTKAHAAKGKEKETEAA